MADSHKVWANELIAGLPQFEWQLLALPGRYFRWRIRGNPLSWLDKLPTQTPDLIVATSMVDIATIKGLHPRLSTVPVYYYFHENQFAYPCSESQFPSIDPQMVQLYGALTSQRLLFNSRFNETSFLEGVETLLKNMPDEVPENVSFRLQTKSEILPVSITPIKPGKKQENLILWNHRWEYDKNPSLFAEAMIALADSGVDFKLALLGAHHSKPFAPLEKLRDELKDYISVDDKVGETEYRQIISKASIVVSTSQHEFQGLSMLEAASAGVIPLAPDALCYREQYAEEYRYPAGDKEAIVSRLTHWLTVELPPAVDVSSWYANALTHRWAELLDE